MSYNDYKLKSWRYNNGSTYVKPYGNHKSKTYDTHPQTKIERNQNMKLKIVLKLQRAQNKKGKRTT